MFEVYGKPDCPWCDKVKGLLQDHEHIYVDLSKWEKESILSLIESAGGYKKVPMVFKSGIFIGGYEECKALLDDK